MKRVAFRLILSLALFAGVLLTAVPSEAVRGCKKDRDAICPLIFDPVNCTHGNKSRVFSNQCFADAECATNCVPLSTS